MFSIGLKAAVRSVLDPQHATRHKEPWMPHWHREPRTAVDCDSFAEQLLRIERRPVDPDRSKGEPDRRAATQALAHAVAEALARDDSPAVLSTAHRLAASDMLNDETLGLYVDLIAHFSADAFAGVRSMLRKNVVMHLSCQARLERAERSCASFAPAMGDSLCQLIVVGDESAAIYRYEAARNVLYVPTSDAYEHLPAKVVSALSFLCWCGADAVLKVDDDHRLKSADALRKAFRSVASARPVQAGVVAALDALGTFNRTWHYGKCSDPALNAQPHSHPMTTRWVNGARGYLMNRLALRLMMWSGVYFSGYITTSLYEDMAVSDLIERQGGRLRSADMATILGTIDDY